MAKKRRKVLHPDTLFAEAAFSSRVTVSGGKIIKVENHRGVLQYTDSYVVLALKKGQLSIMGQELQLEGMSGRCLVIRGKIKSAEWEAADEKN